MLQHQALTLPHRGIYQYHNFSGIRARTHLLHDMLLTTAHDIFICVETFFDQNTNLHKITNGTDFQGYSRIRWQHGGGITILLRAALYITCIDYWDDFRHIEAVSCVVDNQFNLVALYWPLKNEAIGRPRNSNEVLKLISDQAIYNVLANNNWRL